MDTPHPFKRRRLDSALHKPFKSPLRTPLKQSSNASNASNLSNAPQIPSSDPIEVPEDVPKTNLPPKVQSPSTTKPLPAQSDPSDPIHAQIRRITAQSKALERNAIKMRQDIDTLSQALSILRSNKASELEALEEKWRGAARLAAEEIFAGAKDRVNRMGGVGAWRERERERRERQRDGFEMPAREGEDEEGDEDDGDDGERRERLERWDYDFREAEVGRDDGEVGQEEEKYQDDDTFTMDMMLKSLGIDLNLVGYSKERQCWVG